MALWYNLTRTTCTSCKGLFTPSENGSESEKDQRTRTFSCVTTRDVLHSKRSLSCLGGGGPLSWPGDTPILSEGGVPLSWKGHGSKYWGTRLKGHGTRHWDTPLKEHGTRVPPCELTNKLKTLPSSNLWLRAVISNNHQRKNFHFLFCSVWMGLNSWIRNVFTVSVDFNQDIASKLNWTTSSIRYDFWDTNEREAPLHSPIWEQHTRNSHTTLSSVTGHIMVWYFFIHRCCYFCLTIRFYASN